MTDQTRKKKLIEVALPLDAINKASAREKSIRHGHPSTLHLWWARRPLAAARAVIFAQMVDDPSSYPDLFPTEKKQEKERQRLFKIIEELVLWENTTNEEVLQRARDEIWASWRRTCTEFADHPRAKELFDRHKLPAFHDPFAGGGSLPLEAQRLGLEAYASDLNPVAVLINKAMIEIPPKFAGRPPVNPESRGEKELIAREWKGAQGLAEDVRYYGKWMKDEAEKRVGHLYPKIEITPDMAKERPDLKALVGRKLTVIAWIWARTVRSPNPAVSAVEVPLVSTFLLAAKPGKEAHVEPVIEGGAYRFVVKAGLPKDVVAAKNGTRAGKAQDFLCLMSGVPVTRAYIRDEGKAGRLNVRLMATVAEGDRGRMYLSPTDAEEAIAQQAADSAAVAEARTTFLAGSTPTRAMITGGVCSAYGLSTWGHLFTPRQIVALTTFSDLVEMARDRVRHDATAVGMPDDSRSLAEGGTGATAYANSISVYLACAVSRMVNYSATLCVWSSHPKDELAKQVFLRQALPMTWDFAETNPFSSAGGTLDVNVHYLGMAIDRLPGTAAGAAWQASATDINVGYRVISTDPPYYDNVGYADLSDFFYVWLRRSLKTVLPDIFSTLVVPKTEELVATLYRHGTKEKAETFFLDGMTQAMSRLAEQGHPAFPVTIYYAFKQSESDDVDEVANTGWETFLDAVIRAGFGVSGTWPMRTELVGNLKKTVNALASSIVLVCRQRVAGAPAATRRELVSALKTELPMALAHLQRGNIAPVDLAQSAIGPGMAVFTRYSKVIEADGSPMPVRKALQLINQTLDECLAEQEGEFDGDTRFAVTWYETHGMEPGPFGTAETLATARAISVQGVVEAGILEAKGGKVRLLKRAELPDDWDPATDKRLTVWEATQHLIKRLEAQGESGAAELLRKLGGVADAARDLCYRLYTLCERKKWAEEAGHYNGLIVAWPEISKLAAQARGSEQKELFS